MTVAELIEKLQGCNPQATVYIYIDPDAASYHGSELYGHEVHHVDTSQLVNWSADCVYLQ